jgi:hypothetical protein
VESFLWRRLGLSADWPAAAGLRASVFRGLRHLISLLIDTVLDLRTLPAIPPGGG